ncbi:MAG: hypothetical protein Q4C83_00075 [Candidatus Saccharibacteria bacterium]|nr:hypothetical protein [Candidatus Saccharibacteria bacterium]
MADNLNQGDQHYHDLYSNMGLSDDYSNDSDYSTANDYSDFDNNQLDNRSPLRAMENRAAHQQAAINTFKNKKRDIAEQERSSQFNTDDIDLQTNENEGRKERKSSFKKGLVGSGLALLATGGATVGLFTVISGPMQLIQGAEMIKDFKTNIVSLQQSARQLKNNNTLYKYFGKGNTVSDRVKNSRVGLLGRAQALSMEKRLSKNGLSLSSDRLGNARGMSIDLSNKSVGEIDDLVKKLDLPDGKWNIDFNTNTLDIADNIGYGDAKRVISALDDPGKSRVVSWLQTRATLKRNGYVSWLHPFEKLKTKASKKLSDFTDFLQSKVEKIMQGDNVDAKVRNGIDDDAFDDVTNEDGDVVTSKSDAANSARNATSDALKNASDGMEDVARKGNGVRGAFGKAKNAYKKLDDFMNLKGVIGVTAIIGVICMIQSILDEAGPYKQLNVVLVAMKAAALAIGFGSQVQSGQDIDMESAGMAVKMIYGDTVAALDDVGGETGQTVYSSAWQSAAVCSELGTANCANDQNQVPDSLKTVAEPAKIFSVSAIDNALNSILNSGGLAEVMTKGICVLSDIVDSVLNIVETIISEVLTTILASTGLLSGFMSFMMGIFYGKPIDLETLIPEQWGNVLMYGGKFMSNDQALTMGGRQLNTQEAIELNLENRRYLAWRNSQKPLVARLFNPSDYNSAVNQVARAVNINTSDQSLTTQLANVFKTFVSAPNIMATAANQLVGGSAYAASAYDYGVDTWAYSIDEMNSILEDDAYDLVTNTDYILDIFENNADETKRLERYAEKCLSLDISTSGDYKIDPIDNEEGTAWNYVDIKNATDCGNDDNTLRLRLYAMDYFNTVSGMCYYGEEDDSDSNSACDEMQISGSGGDSGSSSGSIDMAGNGDVSEMQKKFYEETNCQQGDYTVSYNGCTTISKWFIEEHTDLKYGIGNGKEVVANLVTANPSAGLSATSTPTKAPALFSTSAREMNASGRTDAGHVGLVVSIDDNGTIQTLETGSNWAGKPNCSFTDTHPASDYQGTDTVFLYLGDHLK